MSHIPEYKRQLHQHSPSIMNESKVSQRIYREQKRIDDRCQKAKSINPKKLCTEMLTNVLKVPECNRPQRTLIKQMIIQHKHINNLFSDKNISFKKQQRISEIMETRSRQTHSQLSKFGHSQTESSIYGGARPSSIMERTLNSSQLLNHDYTMWEMPNLLRQKSLEDQRGPDEEDNSLIEVSKVDLKLKEKPLKLTYYNVKSRNNSQYNTQNNTGMLPINHDESLTLSLLPMNPSTHRKDSSMIVIRDDYKREIDQLTTMTTQLEVKITKPKSQNMMYRPNKTQYFEEPTRSEFNKGKQRQSKFKGMMLNQNSEQNLPKVPVYMHLAQKKPDEESLGSLTFEQSTIPNGQESTERQAMQQEIQKAYQGIKYEAMKQMLMMNIFQSTAQNGFLSSQRSILSRSSLMIQKQLNPNYQKVFKNEQLQALANQATPTITQKKFKLTKTNLNDLDNTNYVAGHETIDTQSIDEKQTGSSPESDSIFKRRSMSLGRTINQQSLLTKQLFSRIQ